ncbi:MULTISPECIES: hypothetical protein [Lichenihabitans]|uniref:hypothetical protein n=1 Tax=Lichenihabitans TaxID=2723776 RepID=UPI001036948D|nr:MULTISPECIES: hypothetical protein [Lichenihabitans]UDL93296.1 hypothetical protein LGH83_11885 [Lichenihabitans sp. PAMC28606]
MNQQNQADTTATAAGSQMIHDNQVWIGTVAQHEQTWRATSRGGLVIGHFPTEQQATAAVSNHHQTARASH